MFPSILPPQPTTSRASQAKGLKQPPGPSWPTALWNTIKFGQDPLSFARELHERYGDVVTLQTMMGPWTLVFHPDGVRHVVQENHQNYRKGGPSDQVLRLTLPGLKARGFFLHPVGLPSIHC